MTVISPSSPRGAGGRQAVSVRTLTVRLILSAYQALCAFGWVLIGPVPPDGDHCTLEGPPPGHPERLCDDRPLTAVELALERQLTG
ncbi:DUF6059 family protein [Streptomyces goshikiensis]|uniref:DUF6059 family protein n=1 Tax=Streptomyces goshikiensis TaxID=1942 RepID=UPI00365FC5C7